MLDPETLKAMLARGLPAEQVLAVAIDELERLKSEAAHAAEAKREAKRRYEADRKRRYRSVKKMAGLMSQNVPNVPRDNRDISEKQEIHQQNQHQMSHGTTGTTEGTTILPSTPSLFTDSQQTTESVREYISAENVPRDTDLDRAVAIYNEAASRSGWPVAKKITPARSRHVRARLNDCGGLAGWQEAIARAERSDFLTGRSPRTGSHSNWTPDLDWFVNAGNFTKVSEGRYDNRPDNSRPPSSPVLAGMARLARRLGLDDDGPERGSQTIPAGAIAAYRAGEI